jgi:hypothetical protein
LPIPLRSQRERLAWGWASIGVFESLRFSVPDRADLKIFFGE